MIGTNLQLAVIEDGQIRLLDDIIDDVISIALARYDGSPTLAAAKLGMGRATVYRRIKRRGRRGTSLAEIRSSQ